MDASRTLDEVLSTLRRQPQLDVEHHPIELALSDDGTLTLSGTARDLRTKRRAVHAAAAIDGVRCVVDRLALPPTEGIGDGAIRVHVRDALLAEPALLECSIREHTKGVSRAVRTIATGRGELCIEVEDGCLTLRGTVPSLSHRWLAMALAWRVPGVRNVLDELTVSPPEADDDGEIADALLVLLETDHAVDPAAMVIHVEDGVVTLRGWVRCRAEREAAERDAWCIESVREVQNELRVTPAFASA